VDESTLQIGLGHLPGSSLPVGGRGTHAIVTGHRGLPSSKLLTDLGKISKGDQFVLYIMGETFTYRVDRIQVVEPSEVQALGIRDDRDYCTLVTCTPYGINSHRLLVRGRRIGNSAEPDWDLLGPDAQRLSRSLVIPLFLAPLLPILLLCILLRCRKIRIKGGLARR
jgi:sortase A